MLYIMRHGKTDWNEQQKLQGRTDIPLNALGRQMAADAGKEYAHIHFDVCYCSPLIRARETAEIMLQGRDIPIITDDRLIEMGFGAYEGVADGFHIPEGTIYDLFHAPENYVPDAGGESFEELYARTGAFLRQVIAPGLKQGKDILIVGHGAMNLSIVCQVKGIPLARFWSTGIENCKLLKLRHEK